MVPGRACAPRSRLRFMLCCWQWQWSGAWALRAVRGVLFALLTLVSLAVYSADEEMPVAQAHDAVITNSDAPSMGELEETGASDESESDEKVPSLGTRVATLGGAVRCYARRAPYVYVGQGDNLRVFDLSDPAVPRQVAWHKLEWIAIEMGVEGDQLVINTQGEHSPRNEIGQESFDISDPSNPQPFTGSRKGYSDELVSQLNDDRGIPSEIESLAGPLQDVKGVLVAGNLLWARDEAHGWHAVDVTQAESPRLIGRVGLPPGEQPLALVEGHVLAGGEQPGLRVYRADAPGSCTLRGELTLDARVTELSLDMTRAALPLAGAGVALVELADPAAPRLIARLPIEGGCRSAVLQGELLATRALELVLWDIADPERPIERFRTWISDAMTTDIAQLESPATFSEGDVQSWSMAAGVLGFVWEDADTGSKGMDLLLLPDGQPPVVYYPAPGGYYDFPRDIRSRNNRFVLNCFARNTQLYLPYLRLFEIRDGLPYEHPRWEESTEIADYALDGDRLYIADGRNGLQVIQLDPHDAARLMQPIEGGESR